MTRAHDLWFFHAAVICHHLHDALPRLPQRQLWKVSIALSLEEESMHFVSISADLVQFAAVSLCSSLGSSFSATACIAEVYTGMMLSFWSASYALCAFCKTHRINSVYGTRLSDDGQRLVNAYCECQSGSKWNTCDS